jgi:hypothetical protein
LSMIVRSNPTLGIVNTSFPLDVRRQFPKVSGNGPETVLGD